MKDTFWFRHDSNAKEDPKCVMLIEQLGLEGYGIYWMLVEILRDQPDYTYPLALVPALARKYNTSAEKVKAVILQYGLFEVEDEKFFFSRSLLERMMQYNQVKQRRTQAAITANNERWKNHPNRIANGVRTESERNPNGVQSESDFIPNRIDNIRIDKNRIDNNINIQSVNTDSSETRVSEPQSGQDKELLQKEIEAAQNEAKPALLTSEQMKGISQYWNALIDQKQAKLPKVVALGDERKKKILVRWKEFARLGSPKEVIVQVFTKACESKFLQGDNGNGWSASFDWIFANDKNWRKIYEGNYDDREPSYSQQQQSRNGLSRSAGYKHVNDIWKGLEPTTEE